MTWFYMDKKIEEDEIYDFIDEVEMDEAHFNEYLDELFEPIRIGTLTFYAGDVLEKMDPIAFEFARQDEVDYIVREIINNPEYGEQYGIYWEE